MALNGFVGASSRSPFYPGIGCKDTGCVIAIRAPTPFRAFPINVISGIPPLSFRAQREIFARKPRFLSRRPSPAFEAVSFEMTAMRQLFLRIGPGASIRNGRRPQD